MENQNAFTSIDIQQVRQQSNLDWANQTWATAEDPDDIETLFKELEKQPRTLTHKAFVILICEIIKAIESLPNYWTDTNRCYSMQLHYKHRLKSNGLKYTMKDDGTVKLDMSESVAEWITKTMIRSATIEVRSPDGSWQKVSVF